MSQVGYIGIKKERDSMLIAVRRIDKPMGSLLKLNVDKPKGSLLKLNEFITRRFYTPDPTLRSHQLERVLLEIDK